MAGFASAWVCRMYNGGPIRNGTLIPDDPVWSPGLNAGQLRPHVDLVNHYFHVDGVAGIRIQGLRCVTQIAHLDAASRSAMRRQLVVAFVATRGSNHVMYGRHRRTIRNKIEG